MSWIALQQKNRQAPELQSVGSELRDWSQLFRQVVDEMHFGTSRLIYDRAEGDTLSQDVAPEMGGLMSEADSERLITNDERVDR